jgi:ABC-type Zn uptake system ZnuABC Zn-binding protein ZnuA
MTSNLFKVSRDDFKRFEKHKEQWDAIREESRSKIEKYSNKMLAMGHVKQKIENKMGP